MIIINRPLDQMFLTNSENMEWLKNYKYNNKLPPIASQIYDFMLYKKLINTFCQEDQYTLGLFIKEWGFSKGIEMCIMEIRSCLSMRRHLKENTMKQQIMSANFAAKQLQREIDENLEEERYEQGLTLEEVAFRNKPYPGGIMKIPEEIILQQQVIDQGENKDVKYWIFDKIYGCWAAALTSPHREKPDGKKGCVILREPKLKELKNWLPTEIIKEQNRQDDYNTAHNKKPNIERIYRVMGINRRQDENLNNEDIF